MNNNPDINKYNNVSPKFNMTNLLYYFGGILSIFSITSLLHSYFKELVGFPLVLISIMLIVITIYIANLLIKNNKRISAGVFITIALSCVPLLAFNLEFSILMHFPSISKNWSTDNFMGILTSYCLPVEIITVIAGFYLFYKYLLPFIFLPVAVTLWIISLNLAGLICPYHTSPSLVSLIFGLVEISAVIYYESRYKPANDYCFWLYIFGAITIWLGILMAMPKGYNLVSAGINLIFLPIGIYLQRRVFVVLGGIGFFICINMYMHDSPLYPFMLLFTGFSIIAIGLYWKKLYSLLIRRYPKLTQYK